MGNEQAQTKPVCGLEKPINPHANPVPFHAQLNAFKNKHIGDACLICGTGYSLGGITPEQVGLVKTIGVNTISKYFSCDYHVVVDKIYPGLYDVPEWNENAEWIIKKNTCEYSFSPYSYPDCSVKWVKIKIASINIGLTKALNRDMIPASYSSTFCAICLALYMGFSKIGIIGFDLKGHHLEKFAPQINDGCKYIWDYCKGEGIEIYNLSDTSLINTLPKTTIDDYFGRWIND